MQLWFVTPAYSRFELAAVCFDQWQQIAASLAAHDIELRVVVVADDENLDLARARGFDTLERDNEWLGQRFNDGIEYACTHGADWIAPVGSDSWLDPEYFLPLPEVGLSRRGRYLAVVRRDSLAELWVTHIGVSPYVYHRSLLEAVGFRPLEDRISKGCDTSTIVGIEYALQRRIDWEEKNLHQYQHISFRGTPHLTKYGRLWAAYGQRELYRPWDVLAEHYPFELVDRARQALGGTFYEVAA